MPPAPSATTPVGRFAPSPTGPLHFGSLLTAVGSYCLAHQAGGSWLLRIEDLDPPRVVPGAADLILRTLDTLALHWDGEVLYQSRRSARYAEALAILEQKGLIYGCACSRKEILASAPHPGEEGPIYPGHCRAGLAPGRSPRAWRLRVPPRSIILTDGVRGRIIQHLAEDVGDFVIRRADGLFAYQLAVVVDDADSGVTQVVRGQDLLTSTPRQIYLQECLGFPHPDYIHLPLALADDGEKISKRHGAVAVSREGGGRLIAAALRFLGQPFPEEWADAPAADVLRWGVAHFNLSRVPKTSQPLPESVRACLF
ncbi:tRNA glutamyl-Q(34) synthetase GluQRS [Trichloromonas sp.]|uniref:tRNA glutamyl-Q(34) synthetase GluQRS n=1 Tax=Trichloromonas sp. TaxID=3069249 RepID=UPI003D814ED9